MCFSQVNVDSHSKTLSYPQSYDLTILWPNIMNLCSIPYASYVTCNSKSSVLWWFSVHVPDKTHPDEEKFQFLVHFWFTTFWKFYFRFACISWKDGKSSFKGFLRDFLGFKYVTYCMFYTPEVYFLPLWPAHRVTVHSKLYSLSFQIYLQGLRKFLLDHISDLSLTWCCRSFFDSR